MPNTYYGGSPAQYAQQQQGNRQQQFRDLINMMVAMQQMKYQKEQDEWGKAMEMRKFQQGQKEFEAEQPYKASLSDYYKHLASPTTTAAQPSAFREKYDVLLRQGTDPKQAAAMAMNWKDPTATGVKDKGPTEQHKRDQAFIKEAITRYDKTINLLKTKKEENTTIGAEVPRRYDDEINNLAEVQAHLLDLQGVSATRELTPEERDVARRIHKGESRAMKEGKFWILDRRGEVTKAVVPQEVQDYVKKNPSVSIEEAMAIYEQWKK